MILKRSLIVSDSESSERSGKIAEIDSENIKSSLSLGNGRRYIFRGGRRGEACCVLR